MKENQLFNYLKKSFITGSFKTISVALVTIILLPLIIQRVGLETYGLISLTMIFGGMIVFADFGISKSVTLLIGQDNKKDNVNSIISNALIINGIILLIIGLILTILLSLEIPILGKSIQISNELKNYIVLIGFVLLGLMLLNNLLTAILEAFYLSHYANIGFTISSISINVFLYCFSLVTDNIFIILLAPVTSFIIVLLYFIFIIKNKINVGLVRPNMKQIKKMLGISYKFLNIGLLNSLMIPSNKYLLIYITGNSSYLALFDIGLKITMIANSFLNSIAQPLFGVFSNIKNNPKRIFAIAKKSSKLIFILYGLGNILFFLVGIYISNIIDQEHGGELYIIAFILLTGITFSSVSEPFYRAIIGLGRLKEAFYLKLLIPIFNILIFFSLSNLNTLKQIAVSYSGAVFISSSVIITYYIFKNKRGVTI